MTTNLGRNTAPDHHADLQVLQRIRKFLLPKDFQISEQLLTELNQGYLLGDAPIDNLLQQGFKFAKPLQQQILNPDNQINENLKNHPDFQLLITQFSNQPSWYNPELARIGAVAYRRYPLMLIWLLRNVALMAGYSIPALSLPLIKTGALVHDALPRLMRTYAYISNSLK
ncbi:MULTISPECIES: hypothetical protein [unclassified Acinetobacter]|uniref:hypothetical protein n=1 Tax=unclassified Acinetobacter TaxID=196816 RepID=UPI0035BAA74A